jgi:hypothetical protein
MASAGDRTIRVPSDLFDSARVEGAKENRSAEQQLEHWTRIGQVACARESAAGRRVEAALAGRLPVERLTAAEAAAFDAEVQARVEARLRTTDVGAVLAGRGVTTVALDEHETLTEYRPDGTSAPV